MAGAGYKVFADGDVLTAAQVQTYLQDQAVMKFADSSARTTGLGTAIAEGMVSYLADTDKVEVYDGSAWAALGGDGFTASTAITATDASWSVPTLDDPVVRVTVIGGGGGGGPGGSGGGAGGASNATAGGSSTFACSAGTATATGGAAGKGPNTSGAAGKPGFAASNGGEPGESNTTGEICRTGSGGIGGAVTVRYFDLTGVSTASVTVGAGGTGSTGTTNGGAGGRGEVIVEYRAG